MLVELVEYESRELSLSSRDIKYLTERHGEHLDIVPSGREQMSRIRARQYVGVIVTPGMEIRISPKMPIPSLLYLISYAYGLAAFRDHVAKHACHEGLLDFLIEVFLGGVERLATEGIRRGYRPRQDLLQFVRGKLQVEQLWRYAAGCRILSPCEFEEFTEDVPENQIIRYTLEILCRMPIRRAQHLLRLRRCRDLFSGVSSRPWTGGEIASKDYDRLIAHYRPIHQVARLIVEGSGIEHGAGTQDHGAFLVNMDRLFEEFVGAWFAENPMPNVRVACQVQGYLDRTRQIGIRPDMCLYADDALGLVADTKYKSSLGGSFSNSDAYQLLAYCRGLGISTGYLLYPNWKGPQRRMTTGDCENVIVLDGIELGDDPDGVEAAMEGLKGRLLRDMRGRKQEGRVVAGGPA